MPRTGVICKTQMLLPYHSSALIHVHRSEIQNRSSKKLALFKNRHLRIVSIPEVFTSPQIKRSTFSFSFSQWLLLQSRLNKQTVAVLAKSCKTLLIPCSLKLPHPLLCMSPRACQSDTLITVASSPSQQPETSSYTAQILRKLIVSIVEFQKTTHEQLCF